MSDSVKQLLIEDLQMAGLARATQRNYLAIVQRFTNRTRTRPQDATECRWPSICAGLIGQGQCQGTIKPVRGALKFVFQNTLQRQWGLFKKGSPPHIASVCPRLPAMPSAAASSLPFIGLRTVSA